MTFIYDKLKNAKRVCLIFNIGNNGIGDLIEFGRMFVALDRFFYDINPTIKIDIIVPDIMKNLYNSIDMKCLDKVISINYIRDDKSISYNKTDDKTFNFNYNGSIDTIINELEVIDFAKQSDIIIDLSSQYSKVYHNNILLPLILYSIENSQLLFYGIKNLLASFNYKNEFDNFIVESPYINDSYVDLLKLYTDADILTLVEKVYKNLPISSFVQQIIDKIPKTKKLIAIMPTSTSYYRKYKLSHWQTIINTLSNEDSFYFIILGGSKYSHLSIINNSEKIESKLLIDGLSDKAKASISNLTGELELEESMSIISNFSDYCITNDTGLAHIAVLCKVPTLMLSIGSFDYKKIHKEAYNILDIYKRFGYACNWLEILAGNTNFNWIAYKCCNTINILYHTIFINLSLKEIYNFVSELELESLDSEKTSIINNQQITKERLSQTILERLLHSIPPERVIETFLTKIVPLKRD